MSLQEGSAGSGRHHTQLNHGKLTQNQNVWRGRLHLDSGIIVLCLQEGSGRHHVPLDHSELTVLSGAANRLFADTADMSDEAVVTLLGALHLVSAASLPSAAQQPGNTKCAPDISVPACCCFCKPHLVQLRHSSCLLQLGLLMAVVHMEHGALECTTPDVVRGSTESHSGAAPRRLHAPRGSSKPTKSCLQTHAYLTLVPRCAGCTRWSAWCRCCTSTWAASTTCGASS